MALKPEEISAENSRLEEELRRALTLNEALKSVAKLNTPRDSEFSEAIHKLGKALVDEGFVIPITHKGDSNMKRPKRWLLTFLWTFPADMISWLAILLIRLLFGSKLFWLDGLWVELRRLSLPDRIWGKKWAGVTMGHGGVLASGRSGGKGADTETERHELVHVEQFEARMLASFVLGLAACIACLCGGAVNTAPWIGLSIWMVSWPLGYAASLAQAYLRGEDPYRGSYLEEAAYAIVENEDNSSRARKLLEDDGRR